MTASGRGVAAARVLLFVVVQTGECAERRLCA